jgi:hypothetical protein
MIALFTNVSGEAGPGHWPVELSKRKQDGGAGDLCRRRAVQSGAQMLAPGTPGS